MLARVTPGQHFVGAKVCAACHPAQAASHAKTGHARSLFRFESHPLRKQFGGLSADWAFGGGDQAVTFVSRADEDYYVEHGLSFYSASGQFGITPGHSNTQGERYRTFDPSAAILRCFQCHSTGPLKLTSEFQVDPAEAGVQCESCHGAGSQHAASPKQRPRNPGRMTGPEMNDFCGACHRQPGSNVASTAWDDPWNVRHQPIYLSQSACFLRGQVKCTTCHPAHQPVSRSAKDYNAACAGCHHQTKHRQPVADRNCSSCHMPVVAPNGNLRFANHWIGVYAPGSPFRPLSRLNR